MAEEHVIHPGPYETSLLNKQPYHVSEHVWSGKNRDLRARRARDSRGENMMLNTVPDEIAPFLRTAGLYYIARVRDVSPNHDLINALVERWRTETHTFHLPIGECTITLQDVALQLGLRIDGRAVSGVTDHPDWAGLAAELLGKRPESINLQGSRVKMSWLNQHFANVRDHVSTHEALINYTRAYILRMFGGLMFPDRSGNKVSLRFLPLLRDFGETECYSWGSAVLAHVYRALCQSTDFTKKEIAGCNLLIQLWAYDRIQGLGLAANLTTLPNEPLGARWVRETKCDYYPLQWYRKKLDRLRESEFAWQPYSEQLLSVLPHDCVRDRFLWKAVVPLLCFNVNEYHQPDRVMRQFGEEQHIPDPPVMDDHLHDISLTGKVDKDWTYEMRQYVRLWENRHQTVYRSQNPYNRQTGPSDKYMRWYNKHTRRWMTHDAAAIVTMTEKLHHLHYMLRPEMRDQCNFEVVYQEIGRCLAVIGELDRITQPAHEAPPPTMPLPQLNRDEFPTVGRKQGRGIQDHRKAHTATDLTYVGAADPPPGDYYVPPQNRWEDYTQYTIPFQPQEPFQTLEPFMSQGVSGYQDFGQPSGSHQQDTIGLQDYGIQSTPSIFDFTNVFSQPPQDTMPSQPAFEQPSQGCFYTPNMPIGQMQSTPPAPIREGPPLENYNQWATTAGANLFGDFGEGSSSHSRVNLNFTLASGGDGVGDEDEDGDGGQDNPETWMERRYDTRQSRRYQ